MGARIAAIHQQLKGLTPTFAELKYLDKVKWHDMYGVDLHLVLVSGCNASIKKTTNYEY